MGSKSEIQAEGDIMSKGSFELSIRAVLILIIAIAMLGIIISFFFIKTTELTNKFDTYIPYSPEAPNVIMFSPANGSFFPINSPVVFSASVTEQKGDRVTKYSWDFEGDGVADQQAGSLSTIEHTYSTPGFYKPTLKALSEKGLQGKGTISIIVMSGNFRNPAKYNNVKFCDFPTDGKKMARLISLAQFNQIDQSGVKANYSYPLYINGCTPSTERVYNSNDYINYWRSVQTFLIASGEEDMISLGYLAGSINTPLFFWDDVDSDLSYFNLKTVLTTGLAQEQKTKIQNAGAVEVKEITVPETTVLLSVS